jgi:hypothetical protein
VRAPQILRPTASRRHDGSASPFSRGRPLFRNKTERHPVTLHVDPLPRDDPFRIVRADGRLTHLVAQADHHEALLELRAIPPLQHAGLTPNIPANEPFPCPEVCTRVCTRRNVTEPNDRERVRERMAELGRASGRARRNKRRPSFLGMLKGAVDEEPERLVDQLLSSAAGSVVAARVLEKAGGLEREDEKPEPAPFGGRRRAMGSRTSCGSLLRLETRSPTSGSR